MPAIQYLEDHCKTAADVLAAAGRVRAFRQSYRGQFHQEPKLVPASKPLPLLAVWPDIRFRGQCMNDYANVARSFPHPVGMPDVRQLSIKTIQIAVCREFNISLTDLISHRRTKSVCIPRHIAFWISRKATTRSYPEIGRQFGGRDHSTGINAFEKIEQLRASGNKEVIAALDRITGALNVREILLEAP